MRRSNRHSTFMEGLGYWESAPQMKHLRRFTLLELMIIVAIIGILISILLPSLQRARAISKTAVCLSNTRELGTGTQLYITNHNYKMARGAEGSDYARSFGASSRGVPFIAIAPYLGLEPLYPNFSSSGRNTYYKSSDIFRCPAKSYNTKVLLDYAVNSLHFKYYYDTGHYAEGGYINAAGYENEFLWPTRYIDNLSDTILFADNYRPSDLTNIYNQRAQFQHPAHLPFKNNGPNMSTWQNRMMPYMDNTHLGKLAIAAFDGSAKTLSLKNASDWPDADRMTGDWD
jgi:hypothetical protein